MSFEAKKVSYKISTPDFMTRTVHSIGEHKDLDQQHMRYHGYNVVYSYVYKSLLLIRDLK